MRVRTVAVDRIVVFLIAVALVTAGGWALAWYMRVDVVRRAVARFDRRLVEDIPGQEWWGTAVFVLMAVSFLVGVALIVLNLSRRRTTSVRLGAGTSVDLAAVAAGAAKLLQSHNDIRRARSRAAMDRGIPTIVVTAHIDATAAIEDVGNFAQRVADAAGNDMSGTAVRVYLVVDKTPGATVPTTTEPTTPLAESTSTHDSAAT